MKIPQSIPPARKFTIMQFNGIRQSNAHCCAGVFGGALEL
jgi:hypothetical protein